MTITQAQFAQLLTVLIPGYLHSGFCQECDGEEKDCNCEGVFIKQSPFAVVY